MVDIRCQVDIIDMRKEQDEEYRFIMYYQDYTTKSIVLRPLQTESAEEVARELTDLFGSFTGLLILTSNKGCRFSNSVIENLITMCPELKLAHVLGQPQYSQKKVNQDIGNLISSWMTENNTKKWLRGLSHIQFRKNQALKGAKVF